MDDEMDKVPITPMSVEGLRFWMRDQSDHAIFIRNDLTAEHAEKAEKAWDFSLKFQELEDAAIKKEGELESLIQKSRPLVSRNIY